MSKEGREDKEQNYLTNSLENDEGVIFPADIKCWSYLLYPVTTIQFYCIYTKGNSLLFFSILCHKINFVPISRLTI